MRLLFVTALLLATIAPTAASAATVGVRLGPPEELGPRFDEVHYVAGAGEANRVVFTYDESQLGVTVTDPGATITPIAPCVAVDAHTARCTARPAAEQERLVYAHAELGDGNDEATSTRGTLTAFGGPGDDRLVGRAGADVLDGGGGTDVLLGGRSHDVLSDGDTDADAGTDQLDGGPGEDTVSYARRRGPVTVDLGADGRGGGPGEADVLRGFEHVQGGAGDDRLAGNDADNELRGGAGDDVLLGQGDSGFQEGDELHGGAGDDTLDGGAGFDDLYGERGTDRVTCGAGPDDVVHEPRRGELLDPSCEEVDYRLGHGDYWTFAPYPRATTPTTARFEPGCPAREELDSGLSSCRGAVTLRAA